MTGLQIIGELAAPRPSAAANQRPAGARPIRKQAPSSGHADDAPLAVQGDEAARQARPGASSDTERTALSASGNSTQKRPGDTATKTTKAAQIQVAIAASVEPADSPFARMVQRLAAVQAQTDTPDSDQLLPDSADVAITPTRPTLDASPLNVGVGVELQAITPHPVTPVMAVEAAQHPATIDKTANATTQATEHLTPQHVTAPIVTSNPSQAVASGIPESDLGAAVSTDAPVRVTAEVVQSLAPANGAAAGNGQDAVKTVRPPVQPDDTVSPDLTSRQLTAPAIVTDQTTVVTPGRQAAPAVQAPIATGQKHSADSIPVDTQPIADTRSEDIPAVANTVRRAVATSPAAARPAVDQTATPGDQDIRMDISIPSQMPDGHEVSAVPLSPNTQQQVSAVTVVDQPAPPTDGSVAPASPADQVVESIRMSESQSNRRVVIRLDPPELGSIRITLRSSADGIRGIVEVDNLRTLAELQQATPPLLQRLADAGIDVRRLEVVLNDQNGQNFGDTSNPDLRDGALAQQNGRQGGPEDEAGRGDAGNTPDQDTADRNDDASYVSDDSINVWI